MTLDLFFIESTILELSSKKRRRSMVFGAPFMIKEFCDWLVSEKKEINQRLSEIIALILLSISSSDIFKDSFIIS